MSRTGLSLQKCWNHASREAVARCPECTKSYCRECVVEHEDRIVCAGCLAKLVGGGKKEARAGFSLAPLWRTAAALLGLMVGWFLFFSAGRVVLSVPDDVHASQVWDQRIKSIMDFDEP